MTEHRSSFPWATSVEQELIDARQVTDRVCRAERLAIRDRLYSRDKCESFNDVFTRRLGRFSLQWLHTAEHVALAHEGQTDKSWGHLARLQLAIGTMDQRILGAFAHISSEEFVPHWMAASQRANRVYTSVLDQLLMASSRARSTAEQTTIRGIVAEIVVLALLNREPSAAIGARQSSVEADMRQGVDAWYYCRTERGALVTGGVQIKNSAVGRQQRSSAIAEINLSRTLGTTMAGLETARLIVDEAVSGKTEAAPALDDRAALMRQALRRPKDNTAPPLVLAS